MPSDQEPTPPDPKAPADVALAHKLVDRIAKILAHNPARVQGAVLADLLATWLGGHFMPGDRKQTDLLRIGLMEEHVKLVADLIPHNEPDIAKVDHPHGHA